MRFSMNQPKFTAEMLAGGITAQGLIKLGPRLVRGINTAYLDVVNRGANYRRWFGGNAANRGVILANMTLMRDFANGAGVGVTLIVKADGPHGNNDAYAWPQGARSLIGQYILNLGSSFGSADILVTNQNIDGYCLITIAHELSHLVFGANQNPPTPEGYCNELYRQDALDLASTDPIWASYNAENYGYFIESCC